MNRLVGALLLSATLVLAARAEASAPPSFRPDRLNVAHDCMVESIWFYDQYRDRFGRDAWVRVLQWGAKENDEVVAGHAVAVFVYQDRLWAWDVNFGYVPLGLPASARNQVARVAAPIVAKYPGVTALYPLYRYDFPQEPDPDPPAVQPLDASSALRDAGVVAARLARHRLVNLVRYKYIEDGVTRESAAAVFVFNGRYCIYLPEQGTVPFRVTGSVRNLRLIQEALRRIHPGAFEVRPFGR